jgi:hypothetical protein
MARLPGRLEAEATGHLLPEESSEDSDHGAAQSVNHARKQNSVVLGTLFCSSLNCVTQRGKGDVLDTEAIV